jgi:hypothetical protein
LVLSLSLLLQLQARTDTKGGDAMSFSKLQRQVELHAS